MNGIRLAGVLLSLTGLLLCLLTCARDIPPFVWEFCSDERVIAGDTLSVSALANDPEGDSVAMRFAWGDADTSAWSGFTARGCTLKVTHIYAVGGLFTIQVQGKDRRGRVSEWQGGIEVSVLDSALVKWFVDIGYVEYAGPAIAADGTIYVSTYGGLCALNPDGSLRWQDDYTYSTYGTPVIGLDGTVYACRDHGLSAFSPDGTLRWFHATYSYCRTPAVGSDGTVYCGAGETLFALSPDDSLLWTYAAGGYIYSSPVIRADGVICFVADYHDVQALNPDGSEKWTWTSPGNRSLRDGLAVGEDGSVFAWSDYGVHAIDADGVSKWQFDGELGSSPVIGPDGALFVGGSDNSALYALDPDGEVQWTLGADDWTFDYGQGLAVSADGVIYHATQRDSFYIVNPDGSVRAVVPTGSRAVGYPTIAQDGSAYFGSRDGCLYALNGTAPLAGGQWPKSGCDIRNSGRAPASDGSARRTR